MRIQIFKVGAPTISIEREDSTVWLPVTIGGVKVEECWSKQAATTLTIKFTSLTKPSCLINVEYDVIMAMPCDHLGHQEIREYKDAKFVKNREISEENMATIHEVEFEVPYINLIRH